jgi:hypothetical protein
MGELKRWAFVAVFQGLFTIGLALWGQTKANQSTCLAYEPAVVNLTGTLVRKTLPGPREYEDIARGDRPETYWLLVLPRPACVDADQALPDLNPAHDHIRTIQLVVSAELYKKYKQLVGRRIVATGTLFGEHTAHHRTSVLLTVKTIAAAN